MSEIFNYVVKEKNFYRLCGVREAGVTVNWDCWNLSVDNSHHIITAEGQQIPAEYSLELTRQFQQTPSDTIKQQSPSKLRSRAAQLGYSTALVLIPLLFIPIKLLTIKVSVFIAFVYYGHYDIQSNNDKHNIPNSLS